MKMLSYLFIFVFAIGLVSADLEVGYNEDTPKVIITQPDAPATNYSQVNVNNSDYWDGLDTPADISITDLGTYDIFVNETGDTMTGQLVVQSGNGKIVTTGSAGSIIAQTSAGQAGGISFGNTADIGISQDGVVNNYDMDGTYIFRQKASNPDGIIEFLWIEEGGDFRFALPSSGADYATGNPRSLIVGYGASNNASDVTCSHNGYDMIDCNTGATGGDLGVTGDIQSLSNLYVGTSGATMTANSTAGRVGIGTSTPSAELDVVGNVEINQNLSIGTTVSPLSNLVYLRNNKPDIYFYDEDWGGQVGTIYGTGQDGATWIDGRMTIQSVSTGGSLFDTLNLKNRRVGIETINPTHTLNVVGDQNLTGDMYFEGFIDAGWNKVTLGDEKTTLNTDGSGRVDLSVLGRTDHEILKIDGDFLDAVFNVSTSTSSKGFTVHAQEPNAFYVSGKDDSSTPSQICIGDVDLGCLSGSQKVLIENIGSARNALTFTSTHTEIEAFANNVFNLVYNGDLDGTHPNTRINAIGNDVRYYGEAGGILQRLAGVTTTLGFYQEKYDVNFTETWGYKAGVNEASQMNRSSTLGDYFGFIADSGTALGTAGTFDIENYYGMKLEDPVDFTGTTTNLTGLWIDRQTTGTNNYGIVLAGDGEGAEIYFGDNKETYLRQEGENFIINSSVGDVMFYGANSSYATIHVNQTVTHTSIFDTSKNTKDYIKNASYYIDSKTGEIDHTKFYGYTQTNVIDPTNFTDVYVDTTYCYEEIYPITGGEIYCQNKEILNVPNVTLISQTDNYKRVYGYKVEEGVSINAEIDLLRQSVFELSQELCLMGRTTFC